MTNKHEWILGDGAGSGQCDHGALGEGHDKPWLEAGSKVHERLCAIIMNKRFLNNIGHYVNFR